MGDDCGMNRELPALSSLNKAMSPYELEQEFWRIIDILEDEKGWYVAQNPNRNHSELIDEVLPMVLFGKWILGLHWNWSKRLSIHPQFEALRQTDKRNYDATYQFGSFQPKIDGPERNGYLEVSRIWLDAHQDKLSDKYLRNV